MTGPDRFLRGAMESALPLLRTLAALIAGILGSEGRISRGAHTRALRLLQPAEALARRLIVLMAWDMGPVPAPVAASPAALSQIHRAARRSGDQSRIAHFQLFEPLPTFSRLIRNRKRPEKPKGPGPRILFLDAPYPAAKTTEPGMPGDHLRRRLAALEKVLANPARRARRHATFLARKVRDNAPLGRVNPIRFGYAPGERSRHTPLELKQLLSFLQIEARAGPPRSLLGLGPTPTVPRGERAMAAGVCTPFPVNRGVCIGLRSTFLLAKHSQYVLRPTP